MKKKPAILVTGGMGYIGSHTTVSLQQQGYRVVIADNLSNAHRFILDRITEITGVRPVFYEIDVCDRDALLQLFEQEKDIAASIHFAALKAVGESVEQPLRYYRNNILSLISLLEAQQEAGIQKLVFSSSCSVYGEPDQLPVTEQTPVKPAVSPYGNTKQVGEEIIADTINVSELKAISLRYFNPVGAHVSTQIGELPNGVPGNLVPVITQTAIGKREVMYVFGDDYSTPDGTCIRDYIHVEDLADAHVVALERMLGNVERPAYEVFNVGTGKGYSVLEVIKAFEDVSGMKLPYRIQSRRSGDVEKVFADTSYSNKVLGWKAEKDIREMMASAWAWEQQLASKKYITG